MRGLLHRAATTALLALLPTVVSAQVGTSPVGTTPTGQTTNSGSQAISANMLVYRAGQSKPIENGQLVYGSKALDCQPDSTFRFEVEYSASITVVEAWLGTGNEDCSLPEMRVLKPGSVSGLTECTKLDEQRNVRNLKMTIPGRKVFDVPETGAEPPPPDAGTSTALTSANVGGMDAGVSTNAGDKQAGEPACDNVKQGQPPYTVWILALPSATTPDTAAQPNLGQFGTLKAKFTPYLATPDEPKDPEPLSGESRIGIKFEASDEDATSLSRYKAYFDLGSPSMSDTECGTGILTDKYSTPISGTIRATSPSSEKEAYISGLTDQDVPREHYVQAVAVAIDAAGNESYLSEPVCVKRTETTSFTDSCKNDPSCAGSLDTCSLSPGREAGMLSLGLLALALGALIQRRRSR